MYGCERYWHLAVVDDVAMTDARKRTIGGCIKIPKLQSGKKVFMMLVKAEGWG